MYSVTFSRDCTVVFPFRANHTLPTPPYCASSLTNSISIGFIDTAKQVLQTGIGQIHRSQTSHPTLHRNKFKCTVQSQNATSYFYQLF